VLQLLILSQIWRWTELLQMLQVSTTVSHARSQATTALLTCSCGSSSQMVCRAAFDSLIILDFGWNLRYFTAWHPIQWVQTWRV